MREADDAAVMSSAIYIDTLEALHEAGDLVQPIQSGVITEANVRGTLANLCRRDQYAREDEEAITYFKAEGSGLADLVAAKVVFLLR